MIGRVRSIARSADALDGVVMAGASLISGGFAYLVLVAAGLLLIDSAALAFLAVMNLLKIAEQMTWVIRNVVAYYTAELALEVNAVSAVGAFLRDRWRWAWLWGGLTAVAFALLTPILKQIVNVDSTWALLAAATALLLLFVRPVTDGTLQGSQNFWGLGGVLVIQEVIRFGLTVGFIMIGLNLAGAVFALPLASAIALVLAYWLLRPYFRAPKVSHIQKVSLPYSMLTLVGLFSFALLVYSDAILVNRLFTQATAVLYTPVNILARMNLFVPLAIGMVLFPKATQKHSLGQDARPYVLLALAATLLPGLGLTAVYFLVPALIVEIVFQGQYADPGTLLGWVGLATTLFAGINIWLNYALALERRPYVLALACIAIGQTAAILVWVSGLGDVAFVMVLSGLIGNFLGALLLLRR